MILFRFLYLPEITTLRFSKFHIYIYIYICARSTGVYIYKRLSHVQMIISKQTVRIAFPFFPLNIFQEYHNLANALARKRKITYIGVAGVASGRLFETP